ncbi:hypothetical protein [Burkholderia stabilis]|uniref:hypothetical protein n=1 Tax=Burkholderia stabilis TaxID=95485 RepID=UPI001588B4CF|nr:hypothetical protein [Burkholderia stabilis]
MPVKKARCTCWSCAAPRFSLPVQSGLDSVSLETDGEAQSPYLAITWRTAPAGIDIHRKYLAHGGATHRFQRFLNGTCADAEAPQ